MKEALGDISDLPERICAYAKCGRRFQPKRRAQLFCRPQCRKASWMEANYIRIGPQTGAGEKCKS